MVLSTVSGFDSLFAMLKSKCTAPLVGNRHASRDHGQKQVWETACGKCSNLARLKVMTKPHITPIILRA